MTDASRPNSDRTAASGGDDPLAYPRAEDRPLSLQEGAELFGFRLMQALILPFGPATRSSIAGWLGRSLGPLVPSFRKRVYDNLDLVAPEVGAAERRRLLADVFDNFARTAVEYDRLPALYRRAKDFKVEGLEHLQAAQAQAGGRLVLVSAHLGNWEAIRAVAALHGVELAIIYRAFNNPAVDRACYRLITSTGQPAFHKGRDGARALFKHVRSGKGAMILVDQRAGGAPLVDFMGRPTETSLAAAQLARTLKAPLLPAVGFREGGTFRVRFEPPVPHGPQLEMMQAVNDAIESWIVAARGQWFWLHRRWKIRREANLHRKQSRAIGIGAFEDED